jgi:glycosyltransferase involved in cell wall biosynthesis
MISVVIPVYKNSGNIAPLVSALEKLSAELNHEFEAVFVVDGSPDDSYLRLSQALPKAAFRSQLLALARNFGSFSAIRAGLEAGKGERFAVMAADLQEPPELIKEFDRELRAGNADVTIGTRVTRNDPFVSTIFSSLFWGFYRRYVQPEIPPGGVDIFGCTRSVRDQIVRLRENHSSLVGLLFWVGFRRALVPYERREREIGKSAWTFQKKLKYMLDSVFSFTDLPIRILTRIGFFGLMISVFLALVVLVARLANTIPVPGYAGTILAVTFFGALNCFGLGIIGSYVFRTFENTKFRPNFIVASHDSFAPVALADGRESGVPEAKASHV